MRRLVLLLLLAAGCSRPDPIASRLTPGQEMMVSEPAPNYKFAILFRRDGITELDLGTKVRIVADTDPAEHAARDVQVIVAEGPNEGVGGKVSRKDMRPLKE